MDKFKFNCIAVICLQFSIFHLKSINGHGMMINPPGRASRWRFNTSAIINNDDNQLFCGGASVQWSENQGKCGLCGDPYGLPTPRPHEFGGLYGEGAIVKTYKQKDGLIPVSVLLTANHRGTFLFEICNMDEEKESDECFAKNKLKLKNGSELYEVTKYVPGWFNTTLRMPEDLLCKHCVLRWTYRAGNNWGICEDGKGALGCGPQEHFRSCADISIRT